MLFGHGCLQGKNIIPIKIKTRQEGETRFLQPVRTMSVCDGLKVSFAADNNWALLFRVTDDQDTLTSITEEDIHRFCNMMDLVFDPKIAPEGQHRRK